MKTTKQKKTTMLILGIPFEIRYKDQLVDDHYGLCNGPERYIEIRNGLDAKLTESVLLHETIHAILYVSGISEHLHVCGPSHQYSSIHESPMEESLVLALEHGLSQLYERKK